MRESLAPVNGFSAELGSLLFRPRPRRFEDDLLEIIAADDDDREIEPALFAHQPATERPAGRRLLGVTIFFAVQGGARTAGRDDRPRRRCDEQPRQGDRNQLPGAWSCCFHTRNPRPASVPDDRKESRGRPWAAAGR